MDYASFTRMVKIVDEAAKSDIHKIRNAQKNLEDSLASIQKLRANVSAMQGQTGSAIVEQSQRMEARIIEMNNKLTATISTIERIVNWYHEEDRRIRNLIDNL